MVDIKKIPAKVFIALIVLILLGIGCLLLWQDKQNGSYAKGGWKKYTNNHYGIQFYYPLDWGTPQISSSGFSQGKEYTINFNKFPSDNNISITMDTNNLVKGGCQMGDDCKVTAAYVRYLEGSFAGKTTDLYSILTRSKGTDTLAVYLIKDLPKLNVSAIKIQYSVELENNSCPNNVYSSTDGCIGDSVYREITKTLNSIGSV